MASTRTVISADHSPLPFRSESSIRYVLVVQECIEDKAPVRFYSRGQKHVFEIEHASEEEADLARAREQVQAAEAERGVQGGVE